MVHSARAACIIALIGLAPAVALAQGAGPQAPAPPAGTATAAPAGTDTSSAAPSDSAAKPVVPATGYGWSTAPAGGHHRGKQRAALAKLDTSGTGTPALW